MIRIFAMVPRCFSGRALTSDSNQTKAVKTAWKIPVVRLRIWNAESQRILTDVPRPDAHGLLRHGDRRETTCPKAGTWLE